MILRRLSLRNFRNYESIDLSFDAGIHLLVGNNAQGKTNLLEAVSYLSTTRSHRCHDDQNLIQEGKEAFVIKESVERRQKQMELRVALNEQGKKLFLYQTAMKRVSDFIGEFNAVLFCPDDMTLFQASPRIRRRFIDMELSKLSKSYTRVLNEVGKLLKERNAALKQNTIDFTYLNILDEQLIDKQVVIMLQRQRFLQDLLAHCKEFYEKLSADHTRLEVQYHSCVAYSDDIDELKEGLRKKYEKNRERDCFLKQTTVGIHKEDFMFLINGNQLSAYASQGQKRSVLLALKVGIVHMIHDLTGEYPVLLLDDVFSELDENRRGMLLCSLTKEVQIFISTTDVREIPRLRDRSYIVWKVKQGELSIMR